MDNSDLTPPKAQSLSDEQLELALEEAKNQGDGMIAAMVLLEQEAQLREQDERVFAQWVERLSNDPRPEAKAALEAALGTPQVVSQSSVEQTQAAFVAPEAVSDFAPLVEPQVDSPEPALELEPEPEADPEPILEQEPEADPEPIPAPVSQEAAFDELLALGSDAATDSISTLPDDFSVTGVVEQIVEKVESDFSASPDEDATALEESAHTPVSSFEPEAAAPVKPAKLAGRNKTAFAVFWNELGLFGLAVPVLIATWATSTAASLATVLVGSFSGLLLVFGLKLIALRSASRASKTHSFIARATYGVFGNILPSTFNAVSRIVVLALLTATATASFNLTIKGAATFDSSAFSGFSYAGVISACFLLVALLVVSSWLVQKYLVRVALSAALLWLAIAAASTGFASSNLGTVDSGSALLIALVVLALGITTIGFGFTSSSLTGSELVRPRVQVASLLATVVVPMVVLVLIFMSVLNPVAGKLHFDSSALQSFAFFSPVWLATSAIWVIGGVFLVLIVSTFDWASESLSALFINRVWLRNTIVALVALAIVVLGELLDGFSSTLVALLMLVLLGPAIWAGAYLTQSLMRQGDYHEVSLMRSYAFYKPASIFALIGYIGILVFGVGITEVSGLAWTGYLNRYLDSLVIFGNFSGVILGFIGASIWTLITSLPRVRNQEREVAAVDERRSEIAGVELPE